MIQKLPNEYLKDFIIRSTYHSNAIEGNTLTLAETKVILDEKQSIGNKSLGEIYEAVNHARAFRYIMSQLENQEPFTLSTILEIHAILLDQISNDNGRFKEYQNIITGSEFQTASPQMVPQLMEQWVDNINYLLEQASTLEDLLRVIAEKHIEFERIHPFSDGNGRTGRMLISYALLSKGFLPVIISNEHRGAYIIALDQQNVAGIIKMLEDSLTYEEERLQAIEHSMNQL